MPGWSVREGWAYQDGEARPLVHWHYGGPVVRCWPEGETGHVAILHDELYFSARPSAEPPDPRFETPRYEVEPFHANSGGRLSPKQRLRGLARDVSALDGTGKPIRVPVVTQEADVAAYGKAYVDVAMPFLDTDLMAAQMRSLQLPWNVEGPVEAYLLWDLKGEPGSRRNCISQACRVLNAGLKGVLPPGLLADALGLRLNVYVRNFLHNLGRIGLEAQRLNLATSHEGFDPDAYALLTQHYPRVG